jgi:hypothetical protein
MRLVTGLVLGGILAAGALGAALSQTRVDPATGAQIPGAAPTGSPEGRRLPATRRPGLSVLNRPPPRPKPTSGDRVDWQAAVGGLRQSGGTNPATNLNQAAVDMTRVPILLPADADLTAGARIYSFGDYYTITADAPGAGVSLSGTTAVVPLPADAPLKITPMGAEGATSQRTVDGQLISFVRYGVLYTVEVRCDAPTDPRCADDNYARGLAAKTTAVVMGAAARAAAGLGAEPMRKLLLLSPLVLALALGACDDKTKPAAPGSGGEIKTPASPEPGPPTPDDEPSDGGAEQPSSEPIPPAPGSPVQPADAAGPLARHLQPQRPGAIPAGQGHGYLDRTVWSPAMCWPLQDDAFANSQVYGHGGGMGPAGTSQCDSGELHPALARHLLRGPLARQSAVRRRRHGPPGPGHPSGRPARRTCIGRWRPRRA